MIILVVGVIVVALIIYAIGCFIGERCFFNLLVSVTLILLALFGFSLLFVSYPYPSMESWSLVSIKDGVVTHHRWCTLANWVRPKQSGKVYWVGSDGELRCESNDISVLTIYNKVQGRARIKASFSFDVPTICSDPDTPPFVTKTYLKLWLEKHDVDLWGLIKEWVKNDMPEGDEKDAIIAKYLGHLHQNRVSFNVKLVFEPS